MCNGWTNRETWLVSLWFGHMFTMEKDDGIEITAEYIESVVTEYVNDIVPASSFIVDMMDLSAINYDELAAAYATDDAVAA